MTWRAIPTGVGLWAWDGPVAAACRAVKLRYETRSEQQTMAGLIEDALSRQQTQRVGILPIEAATGTGKDPCLSRAWSPARRESGSRLLVSTHTSLARRADPAQGWPIAQIVVEAA